MGAEVSEEGPLAVAQRVHSTKRKLHSDETGYRAT